MESIARYFPDLSLRQTEQYKALGALYETWNARINVISRKDIENLYEHHVLHSLGIARFLPFKPGSTVLDVGTGGGFPGIPLAILFPEVQFHLIDRIGKKVTVAREIAAAIRLENVSFGHCSVEDVKERYDFVVSRAVMPLQELHRLCRKNIATVQHNALPNGIICLKGGELQEELKPYRTSVTAINLSDYFSEDFFKTKKVIYLPVK
jgi:16S rRNA (guanine527-N7)-methyltransferase